MRGPINPTPMLVGSVYRLSEIVPAIYQDDPLFLALCAALDDLLAPIVTAVDCFAAYLDPALTPVDFLAWLGGLVGVEPVPSLPEPTARAVVAGAVRSYRIRGTVAWLREAVALAAGVGADQVSVTDPGGVAWSTAPDPVPASPVVDPVRVRVALSPGVDPDRVTATVEAAIRRDLPVHCRIQVDCEIQNGTVEP